MGGAWHLICYVLTCVFVCVCGALINLNTFSLASHAHTIFLLYSHFFHTGDNPAAMYHGHVGGSTKTTQRQLHNFMVMIAIGYRIFHTSVYMRIV